MKIIVFGLTLTSAWGNGHATTYRSLLKALHKRGHVIQFVEKNVEWYQSNRDLPVPEFCGLTLYTNWKESTKELIESCRGADAIVIGSYFPDAVAATKAIAEAGFGPVFFYDIDTPITLAKLRQDSDIEYLERDLVPFYDAYLSFTGGPVIKELEKRFGARRAIPFYCSVDADLYKPAAAEERYKADLSYLGTYAADRQSKLNQLLMQPASLLSKQHFLVAGAMYPQNLNWGPNVTRMAHVAPPDHPPFYSSSRFTLNLTRSDMVAAGYSPSVRLFEASACGATILSDEWEGLEEFLTPGDQVLLPRDEQDVTDILLNLSEAERKKIGDGARQRILAHHTSIHRAIEFENIVSVVSDPLSSNAQKPRTNVQKTADIDRVLAQ